MIAHCNRIYWKNDLPPTTKRFKGLHTDNIGKKIFFRTQRGSNYELVVFMGCKLLLIPLIWHSSLNLNLFAVSNYELVVFMGCKLLSISLIWHSSLNLNLFVVWRRSFSSTVSVCDPLNISDAEENGFAVRWQWAIIPRIVFSLVKQKVSGEQEQEQVFVEMEFTVQVSTFCWTEVAME